MWCLRCSFEDSLSQPADPDLPHPLVPPQQPTDTEASGAQVEAQQAKHAGMSGGVVPKGLPQQFGFKGKLRGSAKAIKAWRARRFVWPTGF